MKKATGETAYDTLLGAVRDGVFAPGDRLREEDVAERLSISRTPVREALRRLEVDGIVEHRARVGAIIRQLSHPEIVELYDMRMVLERTAAEMAAKHATEAEVEVLNELNGQIAKERKDPQRAAVINQDFHQRLYHSCRNRFLVEAARGLNNTLLLLGPTTYTDENRVATVIEQHQAIIDALRAGDGHSAAAAAEAHLHTSLRERLKALKT